MYSIRVADNRELLQPIDTWVRYVAQTLAEDEKMPDEGCAAFIVNHSEQHEWANQGIWYFCAQVAESSKYRVRRSIEDARYMDALITQHIKRTIARYQAISDFALQHGVEL